MRARYHTVIFILVRIGHLLQDSEDLLIWGTAFDSICYRFCHNKSRQGTYSRDSARDRERDSAAGHVTPSFTEIGSTDTLKENCALKRVSYQPFVKSCPSPFSSFEKLETWTAFFWQKYLLLLSSPYLYWNSGSAGIRAEKLGGTMSTIRWW